MILIMVVIVVLVFFVFVCVIIEFFFFNNKVVRVFNVIFLCFELSFWFNVRFCNVIVVFVFVRKYC